MANLLKERNINAIDLIPDLIKIVYNAKIGNENSIEVIINYFKPIVAKIASRYSRTEGNRDDLIQEGNIGLLFAIKNYDFSKSTNFKMYAIYWIKQAIARVFDKMENSIRIPIRKKQLLKKLKYDQDSEDTTKTYLYDYNFVSIEGYTVNGDEEICLVEKIPNNDNPFNDYVVLNAEKEILSKLSILNNKERDIVEKRFGLNGELQMTLKEIGESYNLTSEAIRKIEKRALDKLRKVISKECVF